VEHCGAGAEACGTAGSMAAAGSRAGAGANSSDCATVRTVMAILVFIEGFQFTTA
jgi:hypothetical protein